MIVCSQLLSQKNISKGVLGLLTTYLNFIEFCQQADGTFINYVAYNPKEPTIQNTQEDITDATARAVWALGEVISNALIPDKLRQKAEKLFLLALPNLYNFPHLRSQAFLIKSFITVLPAIPHLHSQLHTLITALTISLAKELKLHTHDSWHWFEEQLGYNNAVLSESLVLGGAFLKNDEYIELGLSSLQFLIDESFSTNMYAPIGHAQWYKRDGVRSYFDQQPEDPAAMIQALVVAHKETGYDSYRNLAHKCFSWFLGNNSLHQALYHYETGGCYDGLHPERVNLNQGAESLVSYLLSRLAINTINS
jgi:hypothetical protein